MVEGAYRGALVFACLRAKEAVRDQMQECSTCWIIPFPLLSSTHSAGEEMD